MRSSNGTSAKAPRAFVPVGTTGESPTLSHAEHEQVIEDGGEGGGRTGARHRRCGVEQHRRGRKGLVRHAARVGASAALVVTPYYNKPTQAGLLAHFPGPPRPAPPISPIIIYNIPGRSAVDMSVATMAELSTLPAHRRRQGRDRRHRPGEPDTRPPAARVSCSSRARTPPRSASTPTAGAAASACRPTSPPGSAPNSRPPPFAGDYAEGPRNTRTSSCRFTRRSSANRGLRARNTGCRFSGAAQTRCVLPLTPVTAPVEAEIRKAMEHAGLLN